MRNLILSAALVTVSLFGMTAQAADVPLEAGKTYVELTNPVPVSVPGNIALLNTSYKRQFEYKVITN